jgi:type 1 glutamine amidotransferase
MRSLVLAALATLAGCGDNADSLSVIVYTRQTQWMHSSNPIAADAIRSMAEREGWHIKVTDDPAVFTVDTLATTDVVVFSVTSGDILDEPARAALEPYFRSGGGFVGIHSATFTEYDWPFYVSTLLPVTFLTHPAPANGAPTNVLPGTLDVVSSDDPIVAGIPNPWLHSDEFYTFQQRPEDIPGMHMLVALDEAAMGPDYPDAVRVGFHPLAFSHENDGLRVFYTALGHTDESYAEPAFLQMLQQGIEWAASPHHMSRSR